MVHQSEIMRKKTVTRKQHQNTTEEVNQIHGTHTLSKTLYLI